MVPCKIKHEEGIYCREQSPTGIDSCHRFTMVVDVQCIYPAITDEVIATKRKSLGI